MRITNPGMKYTNYGCRISIYENIRNSKFLAFHSSFVIRIFIILLFIFPSQSQGQIPFNVKQKKIDSLFSRLKTSRDTAYVNTLNNLSLNLADRNFDSAYRYAQQALAWARFYKYKKGEGVAYYNTGNCYFVKMDLKAALENYFKALRIIETMGPSMDLENLCFQMGYINCLVPNNEKTLDWFKKALNTSQVNRDTLNGEVKACFAITEYCWLSWNASGNQSDTRLLDTALKYIERGEKLLPYDTIRNLDDLVHYLTLKALTLACRGDKQALNTYRQALYFALKMKRTRSFSLWWTEGFDTTESEWWYLGICYLNLGGYILDEGLDLKLSEEYITKSLKVLSDGHRIDVKAIDLMDLGYICELKKKYNKAIYYYKEALATFDTFIIYPDRRRYLPSWSRLKTLSETKANKASFIRLLANVYKTTGDYRKSLEYQALAEEANNNLKMEDFNNQLYLLQSNFENERNASQMASLAGENELQRMKLFRTRILLSGFGVFSLVLVLAIIFYYQRNKLRIRQKSLILEQKLLRSQMNPHFIFNSLSSIQNFIVTEKPDKASLYLSRFSRLVRNILDNSVEEYVVLEKEINTIENYLELQKVRYAGKFNYRIHITDDIDTETLKIPPMLAQPFIENAIEHGIKHRETPGHIDIRFSLKGALLVFEVEDDGIGRQKAREIAILKDPEHRSMATSLTRERLANLNRKLKNKILLEIIDLQNALGEVTGTMVRFGIPVGR
jgi:hypothetical protein